MDFLDLLLISLRTLGKNKMRSGLTVLGVVIGIAAVTTMVSIGQGASQMVLTQFESLGSNVILVFPQRNQTGGVQQGVVATLTDADADAIAVLVSARSGALMNQAEKEVRALLMERHKITPGQPEDFVVRNTTEVANVLTIITGTLTAMLSSIAAISLVVGGVGIMNIMLVSVTERTREIGIRMALGARPRDILRQFLVEAVVLATIGGVIGVALGVGASAGVTF